MQISTWALWLTTGRVCADSSSSMGRCLIHMYCSMGPHPQGAHQSRPVACPWQTPRALAQVLPAAALRRTRLAPLAPGSRAASCCASSALLAQLSILWITPCKLPRIHPLPQHGCCARGALDGSKDWCLQYGLNVGGQHQDVRRQARPRRCALQGSDALLALDVAHQLLGAAYGLKVILDRTRKTLTPKDFAALGTAQRRGWGPQSQSVACREPASDGSPF